MKNKIYILFVCLISFIGINKVYAGNASIQASSTTVKVGDTVTISVFTNNLGGTYKIYSSNNSVLSGGTQNDTYGSVTLTSYFTAKSVGTATVSFGPYATNYLSDPDTDVFFNETRSVTINVVANSTGQTNVNKESTTKKQIDINKTYNSNNYLKSLSISGYNLSPEFNKDTLEYTTTLEDGCTSVNISAEVEEETSTIKGIGDVSVSDGINTIEIIVTAENGNEKTYKILATVNEKDPIKVTINKKEYTVVKKRELLNPVDGYTETTVKINNFDIPAYYNEVVDITLVGLKDSEGNIELYSFDSKTGEYNEYQEYQFDRMNLYIHQDKSSKYKKTKLKINDKDVVAYKIDGVKDYYLLYATNTITGNEGYYLYDTKENSVQRYDESMLNKLTSEKNKYLSIVIVLSFVCLMCMIFLLIEVNKKNKNEG